MQTSSKSRPVAIARARVVVWLAGAVLVVTALVASVALAKPGIVKTRSGAIYSGDVVERGNTITVSIRGVETKIARADIESIEYQTGSLQEQLDERRSKLAADDVKGRVELGRWAMDNQMLQPALELALEATQIDPTDDSAISLRETVRQQQKADRARSKLPHDEKPAIGTTVLAAQPATTTSPTTSPATHSTNPAAPRYLTADDIQQIRRKEIKPGDNVRVQIPPDVKKSYAQRMGLSFSEFNSKTAVEQALAILENGDDKMRSQIKVMSDPEAIIEFKKLHGMIINGCATSNCHGSAATGGNLVLLTQENDPASYTNFYILTQYSKNVGDSTDQGIFGGPTERKLVERGRGDTSLLAQYGLPPAKATYKHPKVTKGPAFNGIFRDVDDPRFKRIVEWMNNGLRGIEPEYHIDYPVHRAPRATTEPSTLPTMTPGSAPGAATRPVRPPATTRPTR
ncbi:MAG: hypothetical protein H7Z14_14640 [Anaerolineae bacterium]|nr:hypothetical protein [Phycisphaerae bacterium]